MCGVSRDGVSRDGPSVPAQAARTRAWTQCNLPLLPPPLRRPYIRCFEGRVISVNLDGLDLNVTLPDSLATMDKLAKL